MLLLWINISLNTIKNSLLNSDLKVNRVTIQKLKNNRKLNQKGQRTAKGIKKNIIKNNIKHINYKETLFNNKQMHHKMKTIRSQNHQLGSYEINKVSLSCYDDKRYILEDGIHTYAYGHKDIGKKIKSGLKVDYKPKKIKVDYKRKN